MINKLLFNKNSFILNPVISHTVKFLDDYSHLLENLSLTDLDILILPINDAKFMDCIGGLHWGILIYQKMSSTFYFYASLKNSLAFEAKVVMSKLCNFMNISKDEVKFTLIINGPSQINNYDCALCYLCV